MKIIMSPVTHSDESFLFDLYADTRKEELAFVPWNEEQKTAFLRQQFETQYQYYTAKYPTASFQILLLDSEKIGRLYISAGEKVIKILDLSIIPEKRNQGIGGSIIAEIVESAHAANKEIEIHLEVYNRSASLFARHGFKVADSDGIYQLWFWENSSETENPANKMSEINQATA